MAEYIKLVNTAGLSREEWLCRRREGIGGSDIAAVAGLSPFRGAFDVYTDKIGLPKPDEENNAMYWGTVLEPIVAKEFERQTGKTVRRCNYTLQSTKTPFAFADVDRMINGENAGLECKTTNAFMAKEWENDEVPAAYICQCQWYMYVTGCEKWYIACLIGGQRFVHSVIERDSELISLLVEKAADFWENNVLKKVPPSANASSSCCEYIKQRYSTDNGSFVPMTSTIANAAAEVFKTKQREKELHSYRTGLENQIKLYMGEAQRGCCEKYETIWKTQNGPARLDIEALVKDYNIQDINDYYTPTTVRKFSVKER